VQEEQKHVLVREQQFIPNTEVQGHQELVEQRGPERCQGWNEARKKMRKGGEGKEWEGDRQERERQKAIQIQEGKWEGREHGIIWRQEFPDRYQKGRNVGTMRLDLAREFPNWAAHRHQG